MSQRFLAPYDPTRFPDGVGTANEGTPLGNFGMPDPTKYHTRFDDFDFLATGTWTAVTATLQAGAGGLLSLAAAGSIISTAASWRFDAGKRQFLKARVAIGAGADLDIGFDTALGAFGGPWISVQAAAITLNIAGQIAAYVPSPAIPNDTFVTIALEHDPHTKKIYLYFNDQRVASVSDAGLVTNTDYLLYASSTGGVSVLDYFFVSMER